MKRVLPLLIIILCLSLLGCTQENNAGRIIFYNTENFFDTIKDPINDDEEFTPAGKDHWTSERYQHKLDNISKVLAAMSEADVPIAIGLSEIETKKVAEDLAATPALRKYDLGVIEQDSPDPRGIDVALLYSKKLLTVDTAEFICVNTPHSTMGTRDILYVIGTVKGIKLHLFVNHWPSRRDGKESSQAKRFVAAEILRHKIDRIQAADKEARIIIMGDLNDNPTDSSITEVMHAIEPKAPFHHDQLYDLMSKPYAEGQYTLKYRGENDVFDQFIVSENMMEAIGAMHVKDNQGHIFKEKWLLFHHPKYGDIPNRTYSGPKYYGGFSDHLPVYIDLEFGKKNSN